MKTPLIWEGEWVLIELNTDPVAADYQPFVMFDVSQNRFSGNAGCNRMSGVLELEKDSGRASFHKILTTRMACPGLEQEQAFLVALKNAARFVPVISDSVATQFIFYDEADNKLFVLQKK
ncbi:MAG: META domain-containing protein [Massilibacteroides sp.]|nr:META domain-containing protein [Massilibacteroides sp.]MDD4115312.1 META domain-containing protein [Massilibacteroides sp.]MDD4659409.1 META domain-containing protein [Massilibacteroides sp.]